MPTQTDEREKSIPRWSITNRLDQRTGSYYLIAVPVPATSKYLICSTTKAPHRVRMPRFPSITAGLIFWISVKAREMSVLPEVTNLVG